MKYKFHLLLLLFLGSSLFNTDLKGQSKSPAKFYLGEYFDLYGPIQKDMWAFSVSLARNKENAVIENKRNELISTLKYYAEIVEGDPNLDGDSLLRLGVLNWLNTITSIMQVDYVKLVSLKSQAQSSVVAMRTYLKNEEESSEKLQLANDELDKVVHQFAKRHSLNIVEIETRKSSQLKRTNLAFRYYHDVYMTFFESFFQENAFNRSINTKQYSKVKLEREKLLEIVHSSLKHMQKHKAFNDDETLKNAGVKILQSYQESAEDYGSKVLEFYSIQARFDSISNKVVSIPATERTQEHVNAYNGAAKAYNSAMIGFENETKSFNARRRNELNAWNNAVNDFISKHGH